MRQLFILFLIGFSVALRDHCSLHLDGSSHLVVERFVDHETFTKGTLVEDLMVSIDVRPMDPCRYRPNDCSLPSSTIIFSTGIIPGRKADMALELRYDYAFQMIEFLEWRSLGPNTMKWTKRSLSLRAPLDHWVKAKISSTAEKASWLIVQEGDVISSVYQGAEGDRFESEEHPSLFFNIGRNFTGNVDEVLVWNLSEEINGAMIDSCHPDSDSAVLLYLSFDECQGNFVSDSSSMHSCARLRPERRWNERGHRGHHRGGYHHRRESRDVGEIEGVVRPTPYWFRSSEDTKSIWEYRSQYCPYSRHQHEGEKNHNQPPEVDPDHDHPEPPHPHPHPHPEPPASEKGPEGPEVPEVPEHENEHESEHGGRHRRHDGEWRHHEKQQQEGEGRHHKDEESRHHKDEEGRHHKDEEGRHHKDEEGRHHKGEEGRHHKGEEGHEGRRHEGYHHRRRWEASIPLLWGTQSPLNLCRPRSAAVLLGQCPYLKPRHDGNNDDDNLPPHPHPIPPYHSESDSDSDSQNFVPPDNVEMNFTYLLGLFFVGLSALGCMCFCIKRKKQSFEYTPISQFNTETHAGAYYYEGEEYDVNVGYPGSYIPNVMQMAYPEDQEEHMMGYPMMPPPNGTPPPYPMMPGVFYTAPYLPQVQPWQPNPMMNHQEDTESQK